MGHRLVVLGASNLVRGFHALVRAAHEAWGPPVEVLAALGHGRSYGMRSAFLGRVLPGIVECGLWRELERRPPLPARALVTDAGNDIVYGAGPDEVLAWIERCVERLRRLESEVVVTGIPLQRLERLTPAGYALVRAAFYSRHRWLPLAHALDQARALAEGLQRLAERHGATFVPLPGEWYGIDPIHMRPSQWQRAWRAILAAGAPSEPAAPDGRLPSALRLYALRPERQWLFGRERRTAQPALLLPSGGSVSLY